jgi:hypothetical protein
MMNFEQQSNQYLKNLITEGVILEGSLIGVQEDLFTSRAIVTLLSGEETKERFIIIYKIGDNLTWKFLNPIDELETNFVDGDWSYPDFEKRIVGPLGLILEYPQFEVWFRLNQLPVVVKDGMFYAYCNYIIVEHQTLVDELGGTITIENRI